MEVGSFLEIPFDPERTLLHLNSFHSKPDFDAFLRGAGERGIRHLLLVSGDGGPRLPRLEPSELGVSAKTVTSVELLQYINKKHPGSFLCGVAFNQYEPEEDEREKLRRKLESGAQFVITQPVVGADATVSALAAVGVPVFLGAWMSKRIDPLCECVGVKKPATAAYDPVANLERIYENYPGWGIYFAQLGFKREWGPLLTQSMHSTKSDL
jgi:methylenetetrahydrofolate reductase (NADPH)